MRTVQSKPWPWEIWSLFFLVSLSSVWADNPSKKWAFYRVQKGDTLYAISRDYKVSVGELKRWNNLKRSRILTGQRVRIRKKGSRFGATTLEQALFGQGQGVNLIANYSHFGRSYRPFQVYRCRKGLSVQSVLKGKVVRTGNMEGYGLYVIVRHSGGGETLYAGLQQWVVSEGASVVRGGKLGLCQNSKLHFVTIKNGKAISPRRFYREYID